MMIDKSLLEVSTFIQSLFFDEVENSQARHCLGLGLESNVLRDEVNFKNDSYPFSSLTSKFDNVFLILKSN